VGVVHFSLGGLCEDSLLGEEKRRSFDSLCSLRMTAFFWPDCL
jgi:hypothetical protein